MLSILRPLLLLGGGVLALASTLNSASAALTISTTRIVYDGGQRSASVLIANPGKQTFAAQAWVNTQTDDTVTPVPFLTTPNLFRLAPNGEQTVKLSHLPNDLPQDRESLFFFNLQEIPQASGEARNALNIAIRTRIKLFYRPAAVQGNPERRLKDLHITTRLQGGQREVVVKNPTPYFYTLNRLELVSGTTRHPLPVADMLAPLAERSYPLPAALADANDLHAVITTINDYGGTTKPLTLPVHTPF
ncbi:molecular chaperone [Pantoea sp. Ap-967]|uniref:fimbrial biogenesis chaperone n=1 Tax=Pantoea sp. Ap-967 TaxID=2608362 RepID=UPI0014243215|nr:molecular chaperone [Pantoea sp. Ap-967]NIE73831.1 molecular chaperone [Pantoea sp. Ap-967]